jgi:sugar O-acyltransferase (sialic acid O-acetyltransferase NeuD family)
VTVRVILLGGGGHAKVVAEALEKSGTEIVAISLLAETPATFCPLARRITDADVMPLVSVESLKLVNGLGGISDTVPRRLLYEKFRVHGVEFETVIHPSAVIASDVSIGDGAQIMAGAVIQPGVSIGANAIVNTRASIDHDCQIGDHTHIAPGVTLSGNVVVGAGAHIGTGACAIQGTRIGESSVVGAGAVVIGSVPAGEHHVGIPAARVKKP